MYKKHGKCFIYQLNQKRSFLHKSCNLKLVHIETSIFMTWVMVALKVNIRWNGSSILFFPFLLTYLNWWFHKVNLLTYDTIKHKVFVFSYNINTILKLKIEISQLYDIEFNYKLFLAIIQCFINDIEESLRRIRSP